MAKYRSKTTASPRKPDESAKDVAEEKKFFKIAIIVTVVLLILVYFLLFSNM